MSYQNWISYRYFLASKGRFLTFLNIVSIVGVALGVIALIVVIAIMTGFRNNWRDKIVGATAHVTILKETKIRDYQTLTDQVKKLEGVEGASPFIQGNIFLEIEGQSAGLMMRGIAAETEGQVTSVNRYLTKGTIEGIKDNGVIIGSELASHYGFILGDDITIISPSSGVAGAGWRYTLKIAGIFSTGMYDFDSNLILVDLKKAQEILNFEGDVATGIGLRMKDPYKADEDKERIYNAIGRQHFITTWIDQNRDFFAALELEKLGLFIILTFMIVVASFSIVSTLVVTVTSKVHDIGILKSIGVPRGAIRGIFIRQGLWIGFLGTFWGVTGGLGVCYLLHKYFKVPREIYSMDTVPVSVQVNDVLIIVGAAMLISFFATIYPAAKAASLEPVEALRYE